MSAARVCAVVFVVCLGLLTVGVVLWQVGRVDPSPDVVDGEHPEDTALAFVRALDARDFDAMWDVASAYERDDRTRAEYAAARAAEPCPEPCPPPPGPDGSGHEVAYVEDDGPWTRVGVRRTAAQPPDDLVEVLLEVTPEGRYAVTATGPPGFDLDDSRSGGLVLGDEDQVGTTRGPA